MKNKQGKEMDLLDQIMAYENDELDVLDEIKLMAKLVQNGMAWTLQGHYGRFANRLIKMEFINHKGELNEEKVNERF